MLMLATAQKGLVTRYAPATQQQRRHDTVITCYMLAGDARVLQIQRKTNPVAPLYQHQMQRLATVLKGLVTRYAPASPQQMSIAEL